MSYVHSSFECTACDQHVIVGGCQGLVLLRQDEIAGYNRGYLFALGMAAAVSVVECLIWLAL